ncbi:MAG TPA: hypothetical protein VHX44_07080 [Planctomycetota bacterium]|nr:hypothetical protein [Planctomycetota bacterium]
MTTRDGGPTTAIMTTVVAPGDDGALIRLPPPRERGERGDHLSAQRLRKGTPLQSQRVIPSNAPLPLAAQRDFRGWIVVAIVVMIFLGIALSVTLVARVSNRTVYYAPTAERIGASTVAREATDFEVTSHAMMIVARMESYTPATSAQVWATMLPFLAPSMHQKIRSEYEEVSRKALALWQHRVAIPLGAALGGRNAGVILVAVFYDSVELTGREEQNRSLSRVVEKAAYIEFAMDVPSKENPLGLVMTRYLPKEREEWLSKGFPNMWASFRQPKPAGGAK